MSSIRFGEQGWYSGKSARPSQCVPGSITLHGITCGLSLLFVLYSAPRFFSSYSGFPLSSKTNISKFQFDLDYCQALYHEPLARVITQALPVFDIKFAFSCTFTFRLAVEVVTNHPLQVGQGFHYGLQQEGNWFSQADKNF